MLNTQTHFKKIFNLVLIFIILSLLMSWTTNDRQKVSIIERAVHQLVLPFQKAFTISTNFLRDTYMSLVDVRNVYLENKRLKEKLAYYQGIEHQLNEARLANRRLTQLLEFKESTDMTLLPAMVIGRSPNTWYSSITISKGEKHNVEVGMPVVTNQGLVGRIIEVGPTTSKVKLIISPDNAVTSFVQRTRDIGLVRVSGENPHLLEISRLAYNVDIQIGDTIMTSGLTGNYPNGIVVGEVIKINNINDQTIALIKPSVDFERLEEVFIITKYDRIEIDEELLEGEE
ncbi:rod shape-determining protein MreC [Anaerobranca californiensis DSM 14826]|jgi:rod shape-determining protein MreC|uniref:Cell shape-determining protein MreC n=1 Tax=Anaerobranca californiensis DSM 14826 TaxID=1120989 RepID=A0A1M6NJ93_9FIRM|nr:rod shape-determining protein MreC [Anaerobranca californiensis]SHJ95716.1 rod shape-determining protein MreC [Anaerobranca californiensis DSM 14826]